MNIKEKLIELGIDVDKDKQSVNMAKDKLKEMGLKADRILTKIDKDGEKALEELFSKGSNLSKPIAVAPPKTIKKDEDIPVNTTSKKQNKSKSLVVETKENVDKEDKDEKVPFWKSLGQKKDNLIIKHKDDDKKNSGGTGVSPNGRPLPKSTLEEIKKKEDERKQQQEEAKKVVKENVETTAPSVKEEKTDQTPKQNINIKNNQEKKFNNNQKQNNQRQYDQNKNNRQNQQNKKNVEGGKGITIPNAGGQNKKISLNTNNANIVLGTNNKFEGKQRDKNKYNRDNEQQKKKNNKSLKNNTKEKYEKNEKNYLKEETGYRKKRKTGAGAFIKPEIVVEKPSEDIKSIVIPENISIKDLAAKLKLQPAVIVKKLFLTGQMVTPNTELTYEEAENIAIEYDVLCEKEQKVDVIAELLRDDIEDNEKDLITRPPVVCVMGHVDHGKTSILDAIRKTNVIDKEAGGITQHIGAYQVKINDRVITFLDTPGHEAFTAMRLRGAKSTDIAVLVVAADDGVMPQTVEAINHARAANVEVVVAINKIDKPEANVDRVKQELSEYELIPEEWGGTTTFCEVAAKKNIGITNLLEMILLTADVMDLKANPNRNARGIVIEAELDKGRGPVARILVQKGTLHVGDYVAMGKSYGKVRAMIDCNGYRVKSATPSTPVEILGLNDTPLAGDTMVAFDSEKDAKNFASTFISEDKQKLIEDSKQKVTLDALFDKIKAGEVKELPVVLKADVVGSGEALKDSLEKLSNDEVAVKVIHTGVGNINESDVNLASASNAIIIGFDVKVETNVKSIIDKEKVDVRLYDVIYKAIEDVELAMKGMLSPVFEERIIGHLVIRQIFKASSVGNIAGCLVTDGEITRNSKVRVFRAENKIFEGELSSLKRFKDEVKEVKQGFECGVVIEGFSDFAVDDTIESYVLESKPLT